jgi:hypothetical protein
LNLHCSLQTTSTVCYDVDWCTKNKRMIRVLSRGLFLTCTENPFLLCTHNIKLRAGAYCLEERKKVPLLGKAVPCSWWWIPILSGPSLKTTAFSPLALPHPHAPASLKMNIYLHTDDINMPTASVRHIYSKCLLLLGLKMHAIVYSAHAVQLKLMIKPLKYISSIFYPRIHPYNYCLNYLFNLINIIFTC